MGNLTLKLVYAFDAEGRPFAGIPFDMQLPSFVQHLSVPEQSRPVVRADSPVSCNARYASCEATFGGLRPRHRRTSQSARR
jgi:hypothetical protein